MVVTDGVIISFILILFFKDNGMSCPLMLFVLAEILQGDQMISVHQIISCLTAWLYLTAWQPTARARVTLDRR
jgi:hypothetical protein